MKHRDYVRRKVRYSNGDYIWIKVERLICKDCHKLQRKLPSFVEPFKQYDKRIIKDVVTEVITPETLGFEDFPSEMTMKRWKKAYKKGR